MRKALVEITEASGARNLAIIAEEPIYEWHEVIVTTSRLTHRGRSYSISNVSAVQVMQPRSGYMLALVCAALFVGVAISALALQSSQLTVLAIALLSVALVFRPATTRHLYIEVGAERLAVSSNDPRVIAEIADAITVAQRAAHSAKRGPASTGDRALARGAAAAAGSGAA
jgi:hypothetical protein